MRKVFFSVFLFVSSVVLAHAQQSRLDGKQKINAALSAVYQQVMLRPGRVTVDSMAVDDRKKTVDFYANLTLSYMPMRETLVVQIYDSVRQYLPAKQKKYRLGVFTDGREISSLVPNYYRQADKDKSRQIAHDIKIPLKTNWFSTEFLCRVQFAAICLCRPAGNNWEPGC